MEKNRFPVSPGLGGGIDSRGRVGTVTADGHSRAVISGRLCQPVIGTAGGGHASTPRLTIGQIPRKHQQEG
ncbi:hypothetical protein AV530_011318 [Patagioenas fasciata monilis]|uniref:Uncharacterized protein n=1 Tax=Patagioenas fasciata monilis TaxID=372326 RepID=A0A1V4KNZ7_PATFA|nr:hypothetical protein AV530_011318 [Patagioenas fasciata monilis]